MSVSFLRRLRGRVNRVLFGFFQAPYLAACGKQALLRRPFRIDGAQFISLGSATVIQEGGWLYCCPEDEKSGRLVIGAGCVLGYNNHIASVKDVVIEDCVLTANNVYISDNVHSFDDVSTPIMHQKVRYKNRVLIREGSWIGENACIIGASVGRNCVIGANAVVTSDIPDYSVAVGAPAVVIKQYDHTTQQWRKVANASSCQQKNVTE
ncbi:acyltransferase [Dechloromonas sp. TW-R-39-2]|uniref:acyltransferase n=1 Tax=Dechloromonas sp. TW-R-39-2 TaxID=2654218 RepID=UPI001AF504FB|nr:acyltransferase [Dechloromonas sp. TW-R-39-2]QRM20148.1 acyltransferase [Dechloromonas sp. TW-R-39-2]